MSYLAQKVYSKFMSNFMLTNPERNSSLTGYTFVYTLKLESQDLELFAKTFARYASAYGLFEGAYFSYATRLSETTQLLEKSIYYSLIKSVKTGYDTLFNVPGTSTYARVDSYVYSGHKILRDIIVAGAFPTYEYNTAMVNVELAFDPQPLEDLKTLPYYNDFVDENTGIVYNSQMEQVLTFLAKRSGQVGVLKFEKLTDLIDSNLNQGVIPLGNLCYSEDMLFINYIETPKFKTDPKSFFWGKANKVALIKAPSVDIDDEIYDTVSVSKLNDTCIGFEIESITGFNPYGYRAPLGKNYSPQNTSPNRPSGGPAIGGTGRGNNPNTGPNTRRGSNTNNPSGPTRNTNNNKFSNLMKDVRNLIPKARNVITNEDVIAVADIIKHQFNKKLSNKQRDALIGKTIRDALIAHGMPHELFDSDHRLDNEIIIQYGQGKSQAFKLLEAPEPV
jgi:hypothetical protein